MPVLFAASGAATAGSIIDMVYRREGRAAESSGYSEPRDGSLRSPHRSRWNGRRPSIPKVGEPLHRGRTAILWKAATRDDGCEPDAVTDSVEIAAKEIAAGSSEPPVHCACASPFTTSATPPRAILAPRFNNSDRRRRRKRDLSRKAKSTLGVGPADLGLLRFWREIEYRVEQVNGFLKAVHVIA